MENKLDGFNADMGSITSKCNQLLSLLHFINIRFSKTVSVKRHLSGRNIFPATLNSHLTGAKDAGTDKYL